MASLISMWDFASEPDNDMQCSRPYLATDPWEAASRGGYATLAYALRFEDWAFGQVWMNVDPDHFTTKIRMRLGSRTRVF